MWQRTLRYIVARACGDLEGCIATGVGRERAIGYHGASIPMNIACKCFMLVVSVT